MRGYRKWIVASLSTILVLGLVALVLNLYAWKLKREVAENQIGPEGGQHAIQDVTITVPPGAVNAPTNLIVTTPKPKPNDASLPFGDLNPPNVQFDISLAGGAQPLKPLDVKIPLTGDFLPTGANPEHALLYSPNQTGEWRLVPGVVENGVLRAKVKSLSPKHIVFFDPAANFWERIKAWEPEGVKNCNREITTNATGKIKLGGSGWKNATDSVLHPCLIEENGKAMLRVGNNSILMWSVIPNGASINAPDGSVENGLIKLIVKTFNSDKRVKAYLAEGDATWTEIGEDSLPVTLEFQANPNTFLARAFWVGLNMSVGMFTGTSGDKTAEVIKSLLIDGSDLVGCLEDAAHSANNIFDVNKIVDTLLSICGEIIAKGVGVNLTSKTVAEWGLGRILAALGGIKDSFGLLGTAYESVKQQLSGGVTVKVERATPPKPPCATLASFKEALGKKGVTVEGAEGIDCSNGWATANVNVPLSNDGYNGHTLIHYIQNSWVHVATLHEPIFYGTPTNDKLCGELPADFRRALCVRI